MTKSSGPAIPPRGPGHCDDDAAWAEFVRQYDGQPRRLDMTDFALANRVFMADRNDLDLIVWQTAAKERIRWLSIELAKAQAALSEERMECAACAGSGKIEEGPRTTGANQHSACRMDCENCDGSGRVPSNSDALALALTALERIKTVDGGGGFLGAQACRQVAAQALTAIAAIQDDRAAG